MCLCLIICYETLTKIEKNFSNYVEHKRNFRRGPSPASEVKKVRLPITPPSSFWELNFKWISKSNK